MRIQILFMKGISKFVTYTFTILFSFIMLGVFSSLIYAYYNQVLKSNIESGLKQICVQTFVGIVDLYNQGVKYDFIPENSTSVLISQISLNYPDSVSGKNFEVYLIPSSGIWSTVKNMTIDGKTVNIKQEIDSGAKIIAKTIEQPYVSYEYDLPNIPIILQGRFRSGDNDNLSLVRYNDNGTIEDSVILGNSDLLVRIKSIH